MDEYDRWLEFCAEVQGDFQDPVEVAISIRDRGLVPPYAPVEEVYAVYYRRWEEA